MIPLKSLDKEEKMISKLSQSGFTLVETMVAVLVGGIVATIVFSQIVLMAQSVRSLRLKTNAISVRQMISRKLRNNRIMQSSIRNNTMITTCFSTGNGCPTAREAFDLHNPDDTLAHTNTIDQGWTNDGRSCTDLSGADPQCLFRENYFFEIICKPQDCANPLLKITGEVEVVNPDLYDEQKISTKPLSRFLSLESSGSIITPNGPSGPVSNGQGLLAKIYPMSDAWARRFGGPPGDPTWLSNTVRWQNFVDDATPPLPSPINVGMSLPPISMSNSVGLTDINGVPVIYNGAQLKTWYALDIEGYLQMPPGTYQFMFSGDDGIMVTIEGRDALSDPARNYDKVVVPHHIACGRDLFTWAAGEKKSFRAQYFQGPPVTVGRELSFRQTSNVGRCSRGSFTVVPDNYFSTSP